MDSGRNSIPLGALSPSSAKTGQRRRCSENDHSCLDAVENMDPNTASGTGTTTFGCRDGFLTPSQRRLHSVDLSKVSTPAPGFQDRLGTQSPTRITQKGFIGSSQASGYIKSDSKRKDLSSPESYTQAWEAWGQ